MPSRVAIIGGGIAGLACACELADAGMRVTVFESRKHLGGRAFSFLDKESGLTIDNCQHVLMGCCHEAIRFLTEIGSIEHVKFHDTLRIVGEDGETLDIESSALPAPLHLLLSILRTRYFTAQDKLNLSRVMMRIALHAPGKEASAAKYLKTLSCSDRLIKRLFEPVLVSALNEDLDQASGRYAKMVLSKALLESKGGYQLGVPVVPLSELIEKPALKFLSKEDCKVRINTGIKNINISQGSVQSLSLDDGERFSSDYYVSAVSPWSLRAMGFKSETLGELKWQPIIGVHIFSDSDCLDFDHTSVLGEPFQWVFNKSRDFGLGHTYIQAVASGASEIVGLTKDELADLALNAIYKASPEAGEMLKSSNFRTVVCRERRATFSTSCGSDTYRPSTITSVGNLFLAGDWTHTHWPSTIESAVRSGQAAAQAVMEASNMPVYRVS